MLAHTIAATLLFSAGMLRADAVSGLVENTLSGLDVRASHTPYSKVISRIYIGRGTDGTPRTGMAQCTIESFKPITGVVIVEKTAQGFLLREALFPDIDKIRNSKDRGQVASILKMFRNIPFDPHAEKSAVDGVTGATRYGARASGLLNYMARQTALEMEANPDWPRTPAEK